MIFPSLDELIAQRIAAIKEAEAQESPSLERTASGAQEPDISEVEELETERSVPRRTSDDFSRHRNEDRIRLHRPMVTDSGRPSIPAFSDLKLKPPKKRKRARKPTSSFFQGYT